jgi:hypothetical protein
MSIEVDLRHILARRNLKEMKRILDCNGIKHVERKSYLS